MLASIVAVLSLVGCTVIERSGSEMELEPVLVDSVQAPCQSTDMETGGVVFGKAACEEGEPGQYYCPGDRICQTLPDGLGGVTIVCQQAPGQPPPPQPGEGTIVREPPEEPHDKEITREDDSCSVAVLAKVRIKRSRRILETHNLAHGFNEVVIPDGFEGQAIFMPGPDGTGPYPGTLTGTWGIEGDANPYTGIVSEDKVRLARGWPRTTGRSGFSPGPRRPDIQRHRPGFYLDNAKVAQVAVTTVRLNFQGQQGIVRPQQPYRQPTISVSFQSRDGCCAGLRQFLDVNSRFLSALERPSQDARGLLLLPPGRYSELSTDVQQWEDAPFEQVRFP
ncbi:MAG: hypothetical protein ABIL58_03320 [Pseudomonadota bacterium]